MTRKFFLFLIISVMQHALLFGEETIELDAVEITSVKQGNDLMREPVSSSVFTRSQIEKENIDGIKEVASLTPNVYIPDYGSRITSSIYVRGLGSRIDHPVIGMNIDNVPVLSKDNFDMQLVELDRIEVLRGPQSTMYGRNTMGGVMNIYTISPLQYQGVNFSMGYGTANSLDAKMSYYTKANNYLGYSISGYYSQSDGYFTNDYNGEKLDWEKSMGAQAKIHYRKGGYDIQNSLAISYVDQGGYPYKLIDAENVSYNDPSSFNRLLLTNGLSISKDLGNKTMHSATSLSFMDNHMALDNDFTDYSYFTLNQLQTEFTLTQDFVLKSKDDKPYSWLAGAFVFAEYNKMSAPVLFKEYGIEKLILANAEEYTGFDYSWNDETLLLESDFVTPTLGASLYHKSSYELGRWLFTGEIRFDYEYALLAYSNYTQANYNVESEGLTYPFTKTIDNEDYLQNAFFELSPKFAVSYSFGQRGLLYSSVAKGYKSGGFNTQMFSDILQQQLMGEMGLKMEYDVDEIVTYQPEYSWNYELGGNFRWSELGLNASVALFFIDCYDQQLTVMPEGTVTGRMMTNAGRTQSKGVELSASWRKNKFSLSADYGYTNAKFVDYQDRVKDDNGDYQSVQYAGNYVPYAPQHTASLRADYTFSLGDEHKLRTSLSANGLGDIYWEESNETCQGFYTLLNASLTYIAKKYSIDIWAKNILNTSYNTFYFESIGNKFVQVGNPISAGIRLNVKL